MSRRAEAIDTQLSPVLPFPAASTLVPAAEAPTALALAGVGRTFSPRSGSRLVALADVTFTAEAGTAILIRGRSGSGKTTLLKVAGCMMRPSSGRVWVAGREVSHLSEDALSDLRRSSFGFVFQACHLVGWSTALANVILPALPGTCSSRRLRRRATDLLDRFELGSRLHERVDRLSGGEQQRVAIARALINDPAVVIADEPTAHLDEETGDLFLDLVDELKAEGRTVLVASHDPNLVALADGGNLPDAPWDRVLELGAGRLLE